MVKIHPTSIVDPKAELAEDVEIGPFCTVGPFVKMGAGCKVISHAVIDGHTTMGSGCTVYQFATIGGMHQHKRCDATDGLLIIGDRNTFREGVTVHIGGSDVDDNITRVGNDNFFLAYSHIAHDCKLGNNIVMSNNASLAGHVKVEDNVTVGGMAGVLQFTRIGKGAMIGAMCGITRDVIPYGIALGGIPSHLAGLNLIGLQRRGMSKEDIFVLQKAYKALFTKKEGTTFVERIQQVEEDSTLGKNIYVQDILNFVKNPSKNNILQAEER